MWSLARMEQFSFQIKSRTSQQTWNRLRALILCAIYPPVMYGVFDNSGTTALMASSFRYTGKIQSLHHQNLAPWPTTAFHIAQILFATFYLIFLRIEILKLTATKHLWAYWHLNIRNNIFFELLVQLLYSLRQGFLIFFCAMGPFKIVVKTYWLLLTKMYLNT